MTNEPQIMKHARASAGRRHALWLVGSNSGYSWGRRLALLFMLSGLCAGCASADQSRGRRSSGTHLPPELLAIPKEGQQVLPLTLLRQKPAEELSPRGRRRPRHLHRRRARKRNVAPVRLVEQSGLPPALGYPIPVREDGTISLPLVAPIRVAGMSVVDAEETVREAYTVKKQILQPGRERIIVSLLQPGTYHILVVRQDAGAGTGSTTPVHSARSRAQRRWSAPRKRGTGYSIELPAYENDVLHALSRTGGLPGLDARNEVVIQRPAMARERQP